MGAPILKSHAIPFPPFFLSSQKILGYKDLTNPINLPCIAEKVRKNGERENREREWKRERE